MAACPTRSEAIEAASEILNALRSNTDESINEAERVSLLKKAKGLANLLETPEDGLLKLAYAPSQLMSLRVCVDLDVFSILSEKPETSAKELAVRTGAEEALIRRLLRVLTISSLVAERGPGLYGPTRWSEKLRTKTGAAMIRWNYDVVNTSFIQTPKWFAQRGYKDPQNINDVPFHLAFDLAVGTDIYTWLTQPENEQHWNNANAFFEGDRGSRPSWVTWFPVCEKLLTGLREDDGPVLVDVAGGRGHDITEFEQQFPDLTGRLVLQDQQPVLDSAVLSPRIEKRVIDFWKDVPVRDSRIYFMKFIMHDFNDEQCIQILKNVAAAMKKGYSQLVIHDFILPDMNCPELSAQWDMAMMAAMAGVERTESQWVSLMKRAGLCIEGLYQPQGDGQGIILASLE
ncbi:S-adenosyl-L-methionine-dependent methyltransferase [Xylariaceae sp. FL0594]|nr:S-adenosyl-L-methionine-dependent methyltransferase [Xylariaceae sp. FL0594]